MTPARRHPIDTLALGLDLGCEPDRRRLELARLRLMETILRRRWRRTRSRLLCAAVAAAEAEGGGA